MKQRIQRESTEIQLHDKTLVSAIMQLEDMAKLYGEDAILNYLTRYDGDTEAVILYTKEETDAEHAERIQKEKTTAERNLKHYTQVCEKLRAQLAEWATE